MITPIKEKNLIYLIGEKTERKYTFDINTCTLYGISGKALKNKPSEIKNINSDSNVFSLLYDYFNNHKKFSEAEWLKAFSLLDKINSVNCIVHCRHSSCSSEIRGLLDEIDYGLFTLKQLLKDCTNDRDFYAGSYIENKKREKFFNLLKNTNHSIREKEEFYSYYKNSYFLINCAKEDIKKFRLCFNYFCELSLLSFSSYAFQTFFSNYFSLCEELKMKPAKENFISHYILVKKIEKKRNEEKNLTALRKNQRKELFFSNDNYMTFIPVTENEFLYEATRQNNCLYRCYLSSVIEGNTNIVFIRDKKKPKKNLVTCEVRQGKIWQFLKPCNNDLTDKDIDLINFKREYQAYLDEIWE